MEKNQAAFIASVVCRAIDYHIMAQRTFVTTPPSPLSDKSIHEAQKAELALAQALEQLPDED